MGFNYFRFLRSKDPFYESGFILSSMVTKPLTVAVRAFVEFIDTNAYDRAIFRNVCKIERHVINRLTKILGCSRRICGGYIVSGGSEANLLSLWLLRNIAQKERKIKKFEVIASKATHYSILKAANILGIRIIYSKLNSEFKIDPLDVSEKISKNTIAVVANIGSVEFGTVDDINQLAKICSEYEVPIHADAAFGGFILSIMGEKYSKIFPGFRCESVYTITADPHKTLFTPIPSGGFFVKNADFLKHIRFKAPYIRGTPPETIIGTRSGASILSVYAVLKYYGVRRLRETYKKCFEVASYFRDKITRSGKFKVYGPLETPIICFKPLTLSTNLLLKKLKDKGWIIYKCSLVNGLRIVFMPHVTKSVIAKFIDDLFYAVEY